MTSKTDSVVMGEGAFAYAPQDDWGLLPEGWWYEEVSAVGVDSKDNVYVFNRGAHPMIVFDREGNFLRAWGKDIFKRPHGVHVAPDDTLWLTDDGDHTVRQCTPEGKVLLTIGVAGRPSDYMSNLPFHRCTHTALSPRGDLFVADGYGNAAVHKYDPGGRLLKTWGEPGSDPGQFNIVHNITCDDDGWVYVADRENHRIQVFDGEGRFETQWHNLHRPSALFTTRGKCPLCYVGESGPSMSVNRHVPNLGARITILDHKGERVGRLGGLRPGLGPGEFMAPHGITVDSHGDIYVGEVSLTAWKTKGPTTEQPERVRCLRKLKKLPAA